jgi:hypothetical protein
MNYSGTIIQESLEDDSVLDGLNITQTKIEVATPEHKTPWVTQWTMHTVEVPDSQAEKVAQQLAEALDSKHNWYADIKNEATHFIIFRNRVFKVDRHRLDQYQDATDYGVSLGIPDYQLDFSPHIIAWERPIK